MMKYLLSAVWVLSMGYPSFGADQNSPLPEASPASQPAPSPSPVLRPTVALFTSLDASVGGPKVFWLKKFYKNYNSKLETIFRDAFAETGYDIVVKHSVDRYELNQELARPEYVAVFWVSHGAPVSMNPAPGIEVEPRLVDISGYDMKDMFRSIHPNARWLSIVACKSNVILDKRVDLSENPELHLHGFDKLVDARKGLKKAIAAALPTLLHPTVAGGYTSSCPKRLGYPIALTRELRVWNQDPGSKYRFPSMTVEMNGKILATFPADTLEAGPVAETQRQTAHLEVPVAADTKPLTAKSFEIKFDSGGEVPLFVDPGCDPKLAKKNRCTPYVPLALGYLDIQGGWKGAEWELFAKKTDGKPFGVTNNLYKYQGPLEITGTPEPFEPFACMPMPAVEVPSSYHAKHNEIVMF